MGLALLSRPDAASTKLPSIRALAAREGIHRNTAAALYRDLERFGLVRPRRGAGTWSCTPPDPLRCPSLGCDDPALGRVLARELARPIRYPPHPGDAVLCPLDRAPRRGVSSIPVAPAGRSLTALRQLPAHGEVVLISRSVPLSRLVRAVLDASGARDAGLTRVDTLAHGSVFGCVVLVDAERAACADGTWATQRGFVPLRLTRSGGRAG